MAASETGREQLNPGHAEIRSEVEVGGSLAIRDGVGVSGWLLTHV